MLKFFRFFVLSLVFVFISSISVFAVTEEYLEDYNFPPFPTTTAGRGYEIVDWVVYRSGATYYAVAQTNFPSALRHSAFNSDGNLYWGCRTTGYRWIPSVDTSWQVHALDVYQNGGSANISLVSPVCTVSDVVYSSYNIQDSEGEVAFFSTPSPTSIMTSIYSSDLVQILQMALKLGVIIVVSWLVLQAGLKVLLRVLARFLPL